MSDVPLALTPAIVLQVMNKKISQTLLRPTECRVRDAMMYRRIISDVSLSIVLVDKAGRWGLPRDTEPIDRTRQQMEGLGTTENVLPPLTV